MSEKAVAPYSSTLAWKIPWTEEPGRLQSMGSLRGGHDFTFTFHFSLSCIEEGNGNPLQCSCMENPRDGGAWWAAVYGVTQSRTRLKRLSSSSSSSSSNKLNVSYQLPLLRRTTITHNTDERCKKKYEKEQLSHPTHHFKNIPCVCEREESEGTQ